jgi:hypothetical protein
MSSSAEVTRLPSLWERVWGRFERAKEKEAPVAKRREATDTERFTCGHHLADSGDGERVECLHCGFAMPNLKGQ